MKNQKTKSRNSTVAMRKKLLALSICFMVFILSTEYTVSSRDLNWWCSQTTHTEPCKYHMIHGAPDSSSSLSRAQFRDMAIRVAMNHALDALSTKWLEPEYQNSREKAAWTNCIQFYSNTVFQLNKTLSFINHTPSDIQTWLSAALTNLHTCQTSIFELNATDKILPLISNNLTQLVGNTLAINSVLSTEEEQNSPSWFSREEVSCLLSQCANVVVAQDASGNFKTITEALEASLNRSDSQRFVIYVKEGIYREYLEIGVHMTNITIIGHSPRTTIISGSRSNASGYCTYDSATVKVSGDGFIAHGITFQNTAGPESGQAVALVSSSDHSVFYRCGFQGYQDTLCVMAQRQFYQQCDIYGTVDYIFGNAAVVLQNCNIYARRPMPGGEIVITAQGRGTPYDNTGISIIDSKVMAATDLKPWSDEYKAYLGRPWKPYARTVYMETYLDNLVDPAGWMKWDDNPSVLSTLYFGEYMNYGPGSSTQGRVRWPGYKNITDKATADYFTVANFIGGQSWLPSTGVPFSSGLRRMK